MKVMDTVKKQTKSLNDILLELAEAADAMGEAQKALTEAYLSTLKEMKDDFEKESVEQVSASAAPTM